MEAAATEAVGDAVLDAVIEIAAAGTAAGAFGAKSAGGVGVTRGGVSRDRCAGWVSAVFLIGSGKRVSDFNIGIDLGAGNATGSAAAICCGAVDSALGSRTAAFAGGTPACGAGVVLCIGECDLAANRSPQ